MAAAGRTLDGQSGAAVMRESTRVRVAHRQQEIVLIDGAQLAELMIDHNLGISPMATYEVKKIDTDYFTE